MEEETHLPADDPAIVELKSSIVRNVAELELVKQDRGDVAESPSPPEANVLQDDDPAKCGCGLISFSLSHQLPSDDTAHHSLQALDRVEFTAAESFFQLMCPRSRDSK
jgi:hypothetical protein